MHFGGAQRGACNFSIHPRPNGFCAPLRAHNQFRGPAGPGAARGRQPPRAWPAGLRGSRQAFSGDARMERPGARVGRAGFPRLEGRARKRVLPVRDGNLRLAGDRWLARPEPRGSPGPGPLTSRRPPCRPGSRLRDGFVLAGGGGAEGGSWREPEVGPAAFLGIRWRHSHPPTVRRVPGWELAAS